MGTGITIRIGGDVDPLVDAFAEAASMGRRAAKDISAGLEPARASMRAAAVDAKGVTRGLQDRGPVNALAAAVRELSAAIRTTFGGMQTGARAATAATNQANKAVRTTRRSFVELAKSTASVISAVGGVAAALLPLLRITRPLILAGRGIAAAFREPLQQAGQAAGGLLSRLRSLAANKTFQRVMVGALAATAAIVGTALAVRGLWRATGPLRSGMASVFRGIVAAARGAANAIHGIFSSVGKGIGRLLPSGPIAKLLGLLGAGGAAFLAFSQIKGGSDLAGDFERVNIALEALTGSAAKGRAVMEEMQRTWAATGVEVAEQAGTIQKFLALGFSSDDAIRLQRNVLDIAGAVGMTSAEASLLGSALAQVKAKGVVSMEELRQQIAEKGVPVFEALADRLGVTQAQLMKLVEDGKVPAQELLDIFLNMEGGFARFRGGAERLGATWGGMLARIRGLWAMVRADFMAPINDALKPALLGGIKLLEGMREQAKAMGRVVGDALLRAFALVKSGRSMEFLGAGVTLAFRMGVDVLMRGLRGAAAFLATALPPVFEMATAKLRDPQFWEGLGEMLTSVMTRLTSALQLAIADIEEAIGKSNAAEERRALQKNAGIRADTHALVGRELINRAGAGDDPARVLREALTAGVGAMVAEMRREGSTGDEVRKAREALAEMLRSVTKEAEALRASVAPKGGAEVQVGDKKSNKNQEEPKPMWQGFSLQTSLGRIGGGGFGMIITPMVAAQQQGNKLLTQIAKNTSARASGGPAVFA